MREFFIAIRLLLLSCFIATPTFAQVNDFVPATTNVMN
jgi:hypothetical protein